MSLICWWPLNGDTKNYGTLGGEVEVAASSPVYTDGKIGKALYTGALSLTAEQWKKIIGNTTSIAMWIYTRNDGSYSSGTQFFGNAGMTKPNNRKFAMFHYPNKTSLHCSWQNDDLDSTDKPNTYVSVSYADFFEIGKWIHLCVVQDAATETVTIYRNGTQYSKINVSGLATMNFKSAAAAPIRNGINYQHTNDIRIYDHALSQAEVKELSRAMAVHYSFNDILAESTTNLITGITSGGRTTVDSSGKIVTTAGTDIDTYFYLKFSKTLEEGKVYTISCIGENIGENTANTGKFFKFGLQGQSNVPQFTIQNGYNSFTFTATATQAVNSLLLDDTARCLTQSKFYNFQLEEKDHATPYTPTSRGSMLVNEANFIQPSNLSNVSLSTDSATGIYSLKCNNTYIKTPITGDVSSGSTISCWVKGDHPKTNAVVFADTDSGLAFGFYSTASAIIACGTSTTYVGTITNWNTGGWNHIAVTRANPSATIDCYINGAKQALSGSNNWSQTTGSGCIIGTRYNGSYGPYYAGLVDDFRLYRTALSETDIQDLYRDKTYFSNEGDILTGQLLEDNVNINITNKSNFECNCILESLDSQYILLESIQSQLNKKQYIDTGYYWTSEKATILADLRIDVNGSSQTVFGSEEPKATGNRYFAHILHGSNGNFSNYIGEGSVGSTKLTIGNRYLLEYIAHGDRKYTTRTTDTSKKTITYNDKTAYSGTIQTRYNSTTDIANRGNIYIFSNHNSSQVPAENGAIQYISQMTLYRFTMFDNDKLVRDFVPVKKNTGEIGLYDLVTGGFFTSPNGVEFIAGAEVKQENEIEFLSDASVQTRQILEI